MNALAQELAINETTKAILPQQQNEARQSAESHDQSQVVPNRLVESLDRLAATSEYLISKPMVRYFPNGQRNGMEGHQQNSQRHEMARYVFMGPANGGEPIR